MTAAADRRLALLVPGLFGPAERPGGGERRFAALETVLARADRRVRDVVGFEARLFDLFGVARPPDSDWPVASVTRIVDAGVVDNDWWMRADPVHLNANSGGLILTDAAELDLTQQEAGGLVAELMEIFTADGWLFKAAHPQRWYLRPLTPPDIRTHALPDIVGRDIDSYLPYGPDAKAWHTILNEIQILLHTSNVNQAREARGELPVNSLWFWGAGRLPQLGGTDWTRVWSDEPLGLGLARLAGIPGAKLPDSPPRWLQDAPAGSQLAVLDQARRAAGCGDGEDWEERMRELDERWVAPALQALNQNAVQQLTLYTDRGAEFTLNKRALRRWWRRRRPLEHYRPSVHGD
ncbi:MAG: hypothetical protein HY942_01480 [Gammaproteobacteria bacterium]|nr:hypothetical protein [Gammaproteobacteria bacterium]